MTFYKTTILKSFPDSYVIAHDSHGSVYASRLWWMLWVIDHDKVQVLDGGQALIQMGRSIPLTNRTIATTPRGKVLAESTEYRDQTSGFLVAPRVSGDLVTVDIRQQHSTQGTTPDSGNLEQLVTTVNGRLGEWITLGTSARDDEQQHRSIATRATLSGDSRRNIALKVEELR